MAKSSDPMVTVEALQNTAGAYPCEKGDHIREEYREQPNGMMAKQPVAYQTFKMFAAHERNANDLDVSDDARRVALGEPSRIVGDRYVQPATVMQLPKSYAQSLVDRGIVRIVDTKTAKKTKEAA